MTGDHPLMVLCAAVLLFAGLTLLVVIVRPDDGQLYTLFGGQFAAFSGALLMHLTGRKPGEPKP